ncbi:MAG: MerR family transcriptional regulator [Pseudomonadales bacterium]|nr:MerR family transcriptional regulator [Pseudomonadales bacterium]
MDEHRYSIGQLADQANVSRRTVHFYVQQELIDPPEGRGRGSFYTARHLEQLQRVLKLQREGLPLRQIQGMPEAAQLRAAAATPDRELVLRLAVAPGVTLELAIGAGGETPTNAQLEQLAQHCAEVLERKR